MFSAAELSMATPQIGDPAHPYSSPQEDMPFLIREHVRKFQWGCSHAAVWRLNKK
jgi:hypothetical protein